MITLKSAREIETHGRVRRVVSRCTQTIYADFIKPGITSWDIEVFVRDYIESHGGIAAQIGFEDYNMPLVQYQ